MSEKRKDGFYPVDFTGTIVNVLVYGGTYYRVLLDKTTMIDKETLDKMQFGNRIEWPKAES